MKNLIILGSGNFAMEIYNYIKLSKKKIKFKGFLDYQEENLKRFNLKNFHLGNEDNYKFLKNDYVIIPIADPTKRKEIYLKIRYKKNIKFFNYIHETAIINKKFVDLGIGNIFAPNCVVTHNVKIGEFNIFNTMVSVGHDVSIGSFNTINSHCDITGNVNVGNSNFFGSRATILPDVYIGNTNTISAGSVMHKRFNKQKNFINRGIFHGNPAKKIGKN